MDSFSSEQIADFIAQCRAQFDDAAIREELKKEGLAPEQIEAGFRALERRAEAESRELGEMARWFFGVVLVAAAGIALAFFASRQAVRPAKGTLSAGTVGVRHLAGERPSSDQPSEGAAEEMPLTPAAPAKAPMDPSGAGPK